MAYHLLLTRPKYEGAAAGYMDRCAKNCVEVASQPEENDFFFFSSPEFQVNPDEYNLMDRESRDPLSSPVAIAQQLYAAQLNMRLAAIDPRDVWPNSIVDICYPTKPDVRNPSNRVALITGYIFVRFADPSNPLPQDILKRSSSNIRYLTVWSHEAPDPSSFNEETGKFTRMVNVYRPYTMPDHEVTSIARTLTDNQTKIVQQLVGKKVRIPSGLFMGMVGKIKKVTYFPDKSDDAIVLLKVIGGGAANGVVNSRIYLSFTLSEL